MAGPLLSTRQLDFDFNAPLLSIPELWTPDDIYDHLTQQMVEKFKEDSRIERKRATVTQKDLADNLSMWANTQPTGGLIFIGVDDDGKISGCKKVGTEHLNEIEAVRRLCSDARFDMRRIDVITSKGVDDFVIAVRVFYREDKLVETAEGNAFVREGDQKRRLTETEKREIRLNKGELDVESERVNAEFPKDFDQKLLSTFREQFLSKRQLSSRYTIEDVLALTKLGKKGARGFEPNLACVLLFAVDPRSIVPGAYIRIIRYDGIEEKFGHSLNNVADRVFDGPMAYQIADAEKFLASQIRNFTRLGPDGRFATNPEYPRSVWLEAVVNAVVHRSYNLRHMNIFVKMFEDKMVIESPGAFMPPTTAKTVYDAHNPRNPNLMWALYYFDYVQCAFEGTRRMREGMRAANLPDPRFTQKQIGTFQVSVTLENDQEHRKSFVRAEAATAINPETYASLSESEKLVVNYLADQPKLDVTDAGLVIGKDWRATKKILDALESKKLIARSAGKARSRHRFYYLVKDGRDAKRTPTK